MSHKGRCFRGARRTKARKAAQAKRRMAARADKRIPWRSDRDPILMSIPAFRTGPWT